MKRIILSTIVAFALAACSNDTEYSDNFMYSDIVTIADAGEGKTTVFTFQRYDDSPTITLSDPSLSVKESYKGKRALLRYYAESKEPYTSGTIKALALSVVNNDTTVIRPISDYNWNERPVYLYSVWRSGNYINLRIRLEYSDKPRAFFLVTDSLTMTDDVPQLYLVHDRKGEAENYLFETYASFDISKVWQLASCKSIDVHINDSNSNKEETYTFNKSY